MAAHEWQLIFVQVFAIWLMLNGFAVIIGTIYGDPMRNVKKLNIWLLNTLRKLIAGVFQWIANMIRPKKPQNNRRGGHR